MLILINAHIVGRNLIILQNQTMPAVIQHGKKKNWVLMLTGTKCNCLPCIIRVTICSEVRFVEIMENVCDRSDHDVSTLV